MKKRMRKMTNSASNMFADYPDLLTVEQVQQALGTGRSMTYRLIRSGAIKHMRIGRNIKVPKRFLIDYVNQSCYNEPVAVGDLSSY